MKCYRDRLCDLSCSQLTSLIEQNKQQIKIHQRDLELMQEVLSEKRSVVGVNDTKQEVEKET